MKKASKIFANIFIGISVFVLIYIYLCMVFVPKDINDLGGDKYFKGKLFEAEAANSLDVMTFGNSNVYYAISPMEMYEEFGVTAFSSGAAWQDIKTINKLLKKAFKKQKPKVVALDTNCLYTEHKKDFFDILPNVPINSFFSYHSRWKDLKLKDFVTLPNFGKKADYKKGYFFTKESSNHAPGNFMGSENSAPLQISKKSLKEVDKFIRTCEKKNVQVLFISTPGPKSWSYAKHNAVKELALTHDIPFVDYNVEMINYPDWKGKFVTTKSDHLNYFGAKLLSQKLAQYLTDNYNLKNHRGDQKYAHWEESLAHYKSEVQWTE